MTSEKEIGYKIGDVPWNKLDGYKELWRKADFDTKEEIVNEQGRLAVELSKPIIKTKFNRNSFIVGVIVGVTICLVILDIYL